MDTALTDNLDKYISTLQRMQREMMGTRSRHPLQHKRHLKTVALKSARDFLMHCALTRTFRRLVRPLSEASYVVLIEVPENWRLADAQATAKAILDDKSVKYCLHPASRGRRGWEIDATEYLESRKLIVFLRAGSVVHEDFSLSATASDRLAPCDIRHLTALSQLRVCGQITRDEASLIAKQPSTRLEAIFRIGQPVRLAVLKLAEMERKQPVVVKPRSLDVTKGFGEASTWAIDLMKDIREWREGRLPWSEVDKGCLFYGPTGTGKTQFTASLAAECDLHLESTSMAQWQRSGDGSLGHMLKAMHNSFEEAKNNAPALLFIDECDAVGDRLKFASRHADYSTQVVNALLECLDGIDGREGVVVVGACNFPSKIDAAVLRSGRLEKHISFPKPDARARTEILQFHLPSLAADPALPAIAARLPEKTGADLERLSREARRTARRERRAITIEDLRGKLEPLPVLNVGYQMHVAVHEAGHAIVAHALNVGKVERVEIYDNETSFSTEVDGHGLTLIGYPPRLFDTIREKRKRIAMHLAGAAAEEVFFKDRSTMSSGYENSDFAQATELAIEMVAKDGFGSCPYFLPNSVDANSPSSLWSDERLAEEVEEILHTEYIRARDMLDGLQKSLMAFATELVKHKKLEGMALEKLWPGSLPSDEPRSMNS